jgi:flavodoxin
MKKILLFTTLLAMAISCTKEKAPKTLVLYYSETGNTRAVAEALQQKLGADIEEILPVVPYTGDFQATIERGRKEMEEDNFPELQPLKSDIASYDIIFLGFPVWFGTYANPVETLLRNADFAGKKIVPFCTFGSGGLDSSIKAIREKAPKAVLLPGYGVRAARLDAVPVEVERFLIGEGFVEGTYEKPADFPAPHPVSEEEAAIFDAAVGSYPMIQAQAQEVASRAVPEGTEYLFSAKDNRGGVIKVYVLAEEGKTPVFTQVLR